MNNNQNMANTAVSQPVAAPVATQPVQNNMPQVQGIAAQQPVQNANPTNGVNQVNAPVANNAMQGANIEYVSPEQLVQNVQAQQVQEQAQYVQPGVYAQPEPTVQPSQESIQQALGNDSFVQPSANVTPMQNTNTSVPNAQPAQPAQPAGSVYDQIVNHLASLNGYTPETVKQYFARSGITPESMESNTQAETPAVTAAPETNSNVDIEALYKTVNSMQESMQQQQIEAARTANRNYYQSQTDSLAEKYFITKETMDKFDKDVVGMLKSMNGGNLPSDLTGINFEQLFLMNNPGVKARPVGQPTAQYDQVPTSYQAPQPMSEEEQAKLISNNMLAQVGFEDLV